MAIQEFKIEHRSGDMFEDITTQTIFIHSCNCEGHWGKGIALELKTRYPAAFEMQRNYCSQHSPNYLLGRSMLIPPIENKTSVQAESQSYIACLFTKRRPGPTKSPKEIEEVLISTRSAMQHLLEGLEKLRENGDLVDAGELRMPKLNSGLFNVPWDRTLDVLENLEVPSQQGKAAIKKIIVYTL